MVEILGMKHRYRTKEQVREENRQAALAAVKAAKGNVTAAAKALGLSRQMLYLLVPGGFHASSK